MAQDEKLRRLDVPETLEDSSASDSEELQAFRSPELNMSDILKGDVQVDISHEGGEFLQILLGETDDSNPKERKRKYDDHRTRRDRLERRQDGFHRQLAEITDAYMRWEAGLGTEGLNNVRLHIDTHAEGLQLRVVDVFSKCLFESQRSC